MEIGVLGLGSYRDIYKKKTPDDFFFYSSPVTPSPKTSPPNPTSPLFKIIINKEIEKPIANAELSK